MMNMRQNVLLLFVVSQMALLYGCGKKEQSFRKALVPVTGTVTVDGQIPDSPVQLICEPMAGLDAEHPTVSSGKTKDGGQLEVSTYESGDGVPEGEYKVLFAWKQFNMGTGTYAGKDKLNGRYDKPEKSEIQFKAEAGKPVDLGTIDLKTK